VDSLSAVVDEKLDRYLTRVNSQVTQQALMRNYSPKDNSIPYVSITIGVTTVVLVVVWRGKYVTREHLSTAVNTMAEGISTLSKSLETLKSNCLDAFSQLTGRVEESIEIQEGVCICHFMTVPSSTQSRSLLDEFAFFLVFGLLIPFVRCASLFRT
jgi:hypothetical protein